MKHSIRKLTTGLFALLLVAGLAPLATRAAERFPSVISLPNGWLPEGVVTGDGPVIYSGSRANGAIYAADLRTGTGRILVPGQSGRVAVGVSFDSRSKYIFVAGGPTGMAYVYSATSGQEVGAYSLTPASQTFINDVIVTRDAAYFTNSSRKEFYRLPLGSGGSLPPAAAVQTIPLSGDYEQVAGFNANGIEATPNGKALLIVNSSTGRLYRVDPVTGAAVAIDLGGASVSNGDGLLLQGKTLYVVRNSLNQIAVVELKPDLRSGRVVSTMTSPLFDTPTTIAMLGSSLYAVNARFTTPPTPDTTYTIVRVAR